MFDSETAAGTFTNPVYSRSFPDPFVLKYAGEYFAYSTGFAPDGNVFAVLHSRDLVTWSELGSAMIPLEDSPPFYWAPEVIYDNGKFYLYYSVGNETLMELRVAVSDRPHGGFVDSGRKLTTQDFAIDAHVFTDSDGTRWMFYATDFLEHTHIGTGTVVDRMSDLFTLEGRPRPVTRAKYDWQVYDPNRKEKGGVRWHTVEGPTILKRKGVYYEMFSGGNWQNTSYGVSFAVTDDVKRSEEWAQFSDGINVLPILRTIPGVVEGPGHNSVVRGPNNRELYCVYHRWVGGERVLAIDRMDFAGDRIFVVGPTTEPQPLPLTPTIERFRNARVSEAVSMSGSWQFTEAGAFNDPVGRNEIKIRTSSESFLLELASSLSRSSNIQGSCGLVIETASGPTTINLIPEGGSFEVMSGPSGSPSVFALPPAYLPDAPHLFRIELDHRRFRVAIDGILLLPWRPLEASISGVTIFADHQSLSVDSLELTIGFEELFDDDTPLDERGWEIDSESDYKSSGGEVVFSDSSFVMRKGRAHRDVEVATNFRIGVPSSQGRFRLTLTGENDEAFHFSVDTKRSALEVRGSTTESFPLPANLDLTQYHQLRVMKLRSHVICYFDDVTVGGFEIADGEAHVSVSGAGPEVAIEMIRVTALGQRAPGNL